MKLKIPSSALVVLASAAALAQAQPRVQPRGKGPVATACKTDILKFCSDKSHQFGEVRDCLTANKGKLTKACQVALDTTGPGKGGGRRAK